jgi:long-chain acyl-CoA synthetase
MSSADRFPTLWEVLDNHNAVMPNRAAVGCGNYRATWAQTHARVTRLAAALTAQGVGPGERVLWLGQNYHHVLELLLAVSRLGALLCPVNWRQSADELAFVIDDIEPRVVVWQEREIGNAVRGARQTAAAAAAAVWIQHDGPDELTEYERMVADADPSTVPLIPADPEAGVVILYTAAFEGRPNGAILSSRAWLAQSVVTASVADLTADEVCLNAGPLFHVGALRNTMATLMLGGFNLFMPRIDPVDLCELITKESVTTCWLPRLTVDQMVEANRDGRYDLSNLRSEPVTPEWDAMVAVRKRRYRSGYGQTETAGLVTFADTEHPGIGGFGRPSPLMTLRVVDADGTPLPTGETGEIVVRGPLVMNGYHRRPELTERRSRGGWHHTHDLGRLEADGTLSFVGPMTRIVKSGHENIYPAEVEAALRGHPGVAAAAVIGVPDPAWHQSVKAVIVRAPDTADVTADELIEHCRRRIASYKKPKLVEFVDALPRTGAGGVDYDALDARYGGGGYPSSL